ncbi:MAG: hypothetical protein EOP07_24695, partial [Proteobacteria bacterium]
MTYKNNSKFFAIVLVLIGIFASRFAAAATLCGAGESNRMFMGAASSDAQARAIATKKCMRSGRVGSCNKVACVSQLMSAAKIKQWNALGTPVSGNKARAANKAEDAGKANRVKPRKNRPSGNDKDGG